MTDTTTPRETLRDLIAEKIQKCGPGADPIAYADAVIDLFEVSEETWLIATVPGANGPVDIKTQIRMPDREPVSHTRFALRTEPVPSRPGEARGAAA